jgi:hypothetical protein
MKIGFIFEKEADLSKLKKFHRMRPTQIDFDILTTLRIDMINMSDIVG